MGRVLWMMEEKGGGEGVFFVWGGFSGAWKALDDWMPVLWLYLTCLTTRNFFHVSSAELGKVLAVCMCVHMFMYVCVWGDEELVDEKIQKRRLEWLGHLARMPDHRLPRV